MGRNGNSAHSKERAKVGGRSKTARFCVAEIQPTGSAKSVFVTSLHLNHRTEPFRLNEIDLIHQVLANALTEEDHKAGEASDRPHANMDRGFQCIDQRGLQ